MTKKILSILIVLLISSTCAFAAGDTQAITPEVAKAIKDYKAGNNVGCIQGLYNYMKYGNGLRNQLALYYMGMAYVKTGDVAKARHYYEGAKNLDPNSTIGKYADKGLVCINTPEECYLNAKEESTVTNKPVYQSDLDKFINAPYGNGLSADLNKELERKRVERLRKEMNSDQEINKFDFKNFRNFTNKKGQAIIEKIDGLKVASNSTPTDEEVLNAIKVLNAAGLNNIAKQAEDSRAIKQQKETVNEVKSAYKPDLTREEYQKQIQQEMMQAQMASMAQPNIGALFGEQNNNQNNNMMMNNNMMNMLPFMMAQQAQNGNQNGQQMMSPDMMQAMMFNSMMPNFNFGLGNGN